MFLNNKSPTHDAFGIKYLVRKILMISIHDNLLAQQNMSEFFKCFYYCQELSLSCSVVKLRAVQLATVISNRLPILGNSRAQLIFTCVGENLEGLAEIREQKHDARRCYAFDGAECCLLGPLPCGFVTRECRQRRECIRASNPCVSVVVDQPDKATKLLFVLWWLNATERISLGKMPLRVIQ